MVYLKFNLHPLTKNSFKIGMIILLGFIIGWGKFKKILLYSLISGIFFMAVYNSFPSVKEDIKQYEKDRGN